MKKDRRHRAAFILKPYSQLFGHTIVTSFSVLLIWSVYGFIRQPNIDAILSLLGSLMLLLFFVYVFRRGYRSILIREGEVVILNWLSKDQVYPIEQVKGYLLKETWRNDYSITTDIILITSDNERTAITREYFYDTKLDRLIEAFKRYGIPYLGLDEIKLKGKHVYERVGMYVYFIGLTLLLLLKLVLCFYK